MAMVWLITGASSGLGDGIARAVLDRGDFAAVTSRDTNRLKSLAGQYPNQVFPLSLDLNHPASIQQAVQSVQERFAVPSETGITRRQKAHWNWLVRRWRRRFSRWESASCWQSQGRCVPGSMANG